jgi:hypothetical protein
LGNGNYGKYFGGVPGGLHNATDVFLRELKFSFGTKPGNNCNSAVE